MRTNNDWINVSESEMESGKQRSMFQRITEAEVFHVVLLASK